MLKEKYTDAEGSLMSNHPTFRQFQYYYSKHKSLQTFYISRDGLTHYQRNNRPLLGEGVREFAPNVGVGMLDSTICDIYLANDIGEVVGRPLGISLLRSIKKPLRAWRDILNGEVISTKFRQRTCFLCRFVL